MVERSYSVMKDLQGYFKYGQRRAIYNAAESIRDKVLVRLLWVTGRRITEILDVKVHEIDFQINMISFHIEKKTERIDGVRTKKDIVKLKPIDGFTAELLKYYIQQEDLKLTDYLFPSPFKADKAITRQRAFQLIRELCEKAGILTVGRTKPHPHHFRHSYAIDLAKKMKSPADVRKLQMILDHSNLGVTEQYLQFSDEELRGMVEDIGD